MSIDNAIREVLENAISVEVLEKVDVDEFIKFYLSLPYLKPVAAIRKDNILFAFVFRYLAEIQYRKEATYGSSWCKRGEMDVFFNLARKFDRIENIQLKSARDEVGESKVDTVADLANYGILWMTYTLSHNPEAFEAWISNNLGA